MHEQGKVIIIPDEEKIIQDKYEQGIIKNNLEAFQDFSDKFKLGYNFSLGDYQDAPLELANQGHLIVKELGVNDITIFYIPRKITERQLTWMEYNKMEFLNKNLVGAYSLTFEEDEPEQISGITDIVNEIRKKYKRYKKEVDENVGKKI